MMRAEVNSEANSQVKDRVVVGEENLGFQLPLRQRKGNGPLNSFASTFPDLVCHASPHQVHCVPGQLGHINGVIGVGLWEALHRTS